MRRLCLLLMVPLFAAVTILTSTTANAEPLTKNYVALYWAQSQAGKPYVWGGTGPYGYDCSGLVQTAYRHVGISLPRTTYAMLGSPKLVRVSASQVRPGDLAFFGSGHVELYSNNHTTFGASSFGNPVWWHHEWPSWHPTEFFRVAGA